MDALEKRWAELQYYFLCVKVYKINSDIADVLNLLEAIGLLYRYSVNMAQYIAKQLLTNMRYKPTRKETALLAHHLNVPTAKIIDVTGYSARQIYRIFKEEVYDHLRFVPAFEDEHYKIMKDVLDAFEKLKDLKL